VSDYNVLVTTALICHAWKIFNAWEHRSVDRENVAKMYVTKVNRISCAQSQLP